MIDDLASLALDCIYACDDPDMYEKARDILDSIPEDAKRTSAVCNLLEELERELDCTRLLSKYGVKTTLKFVQKNKNDSDVARSLLTEMARSLNKKYIHLNKPYIQSLLIIKIIFMIIKNSNKNNMFVLMYFYYI